MARQDKLLVWLRGEVKTPPFTSTARVEAGSLLRRLQRGEMPGMPNVRPMPAIGKRCYELRIGDAGKVWRIVYRLDQDAVVIADVFRSQRERRRMTEPAEESESMKSAKRKRLEAAGWRVGTARGFLGLSAAEAELVEMRVALAAGLRARRERARLTQTALAKQLKSSQSRIAKMEAGDPTVSLDLLIRAHLTLGAKRAEIGRFLAQGR
jgi:phage-related protein/DNA-binding XRE family transcriptional regulator